MLVTGDDDPGYNYVNQDKGWRIQEKLYLGSKDVLKLSPAMHSCPALDLFDSNPVFVRCDIHTEGGKGNKISQKLFHRELNIQIRTPIFPTFFHATREASIHEAE